ncbi:MAG: hypothetical protein WC479_09905 [Candidatus Izemoplasmatales bacterium]
MELTNMLKVRASKSVMDSVDTPKLVDVIQSFSNKQFGQYGDEFMFALQGLMIEIVKEINNRRKT